MTGRPEIVAVDGADTFLGRAIVEELARRDVQTRGLVLNADAHLPSGVETKVVPLGGDATVMDDALAGAGALVMARKLLVESPSRGETFDAVHATRTELLLRSAKQQKVERFAYIAMAGADHGGPAEMIRAERRAEKVIAEADIERLVIKTSLVVGPNDGHVFHLVRKVKRAGPFATFVGQGWARGAPMPARDFGRCIAELVTAEQFRTGEVGLGGRERLTAMEIFQRLQAHFGRSKINIHVMVSFARLAAWLASKFSKEPYLSPARLSWLTHNRVPDSNVARELLGRFPRPFESAFGPGVAATRAEAPEQPATESP